MVFLIHFADDAAGCGESLAGHGRNDLVGVNGLGLFNGLFPHIDTNISGFHRVIGQGFVCAWEFFVLGVCRPLLDELGVGRALDRLEVIPGSQMAHQRFGIDTAQLLFSHRESHHRHVFGFQAGIAQLFVERNIRVAVDGGDHGCFAANRELFDVCDDGLVVRVAKRGVLLIDVGVFDTLGLEVGAQNLVSGARVHIVCAQQHPALGTTAFFAHQVIHGRNGLLIRRSTGIKHVFRQLFALILHRVEQQAVHFFHHGQHRLARDRCPAAEDHRHLVLTQQLLGFFSEQWPVRGRVNNHRLQLFAEHAAFGIDLVNGHQDGVFENGLRNRHGARQAVQDTDFDGTTSLRQCPARRACHGKCCSGAQRFKGVATIH